MEHKETKAEYAYRQIKERIINNEYKPGLLLVERAICEDFKVSRTPVREAFRLLENDGLVQIVPNRGASVTNASHENMIELFEMREALERMAVRLLILKASQATLREVEALGQEQIDAYERGEYHVFMRMDMEMHKRIATGSNNKRLVANINAIYDQVSMLAISANDDPVLLKAALESHKRLLLAIQNRDPDEAESAMKDHIVYVKNYHVSKALGIELLHSQAVFAGNGGFSNDGENERDRDARSG